MRKGEIEMAKRITPEMIEQINELYCQIGVKSRVAKELGISASSVSKYIQPDYVPKAERKTEEKFTKEPQGININDIIGRPREELMYFFTHLSEEEWTDLKELQKGICI